jgi:hypothetical protein
MRKSHVVVYAPQVEQIVVPLEGFAAALIQGNGRSNAPCAL